MNSDYLKEEAKEFKLIVKMMIVKMLIGITIILVNSRDNVGGSHDTDKKTVDFDRKEDGHNDKTDYHNKFKCGDIDVEAYGGVCECGNSTTMYTDSIHCCVPPPSNSGKKCHVTKTDSFDRVVRASCPNGEVKKLYELCNGKCYNSFENSEYIGDNAQYQCSATDQCFPIKAMCQGVEICSSLSVYDVCDQSLRCRYGYEYRENFTTILVDNHHFCFDKSDENNGVYDGIIRMDESSVDKTDNSNENVDWSEILKPCSDGVYDDMDGIQCDNDYNGCTANFYFCTKSGKSAGVCQVGNYSVQYNDIQLCKNFTAWNKINITCNLMSTSGNDEVFGYGYRCRGDMMHCHFPWYGQRGIANIRTLVNLGIDTTVFPPNCLDKSDQQFPTKTSCSKFNEKFLTKYINNFCTKQDDCINETKAWYSNENNDRVLDPYHCQQSCNEEERKSKGRDCEACTNPSYFLCGKSGQCLHPSLRCDGHPQCPEAEDEDFQICSNEYFRKKIIAPYATIRCKSSMYPTVQTVATACNGVWECSDGRDEQNCSSKNDLVLIVTSIGILLIFFLLRVSTYFQNKYSVNYDTYEMYDNSMNLIRNYEHNHDDETAIKQVNSYLLHILHSKSSLEKKEICTIFYNIVSKIYEDDEAEVFSYLHNNFDPTVAKMVNEAVNPGLKQAIINLLEKKSSTFWLTNLIDKVALNQRLNQILYQITVSFRILMVYLDLFKDCLLTYTIYTLTGGFSALMDFPTNFSSALVFFFTTTIVFTLFVTSLHLTINYPGLMIYSYGMKTLTGFWRHFLHIVNILTSFINPLLLANTCESALDDLKVEAQKGPSEKVLFLAQTCQKFQKIQSDFVRIELILEIFYQTAAQVILWYFSTSKSKTTGGLETLFEGSSSFLGINFTPETVLLLSIAWSLKTCVSSHIRAIATEKQFLGLKAKAVIFLWAVCSTCRRILSMVMFWTPCFGLFGILSHWNFEQVGYKVRIDYAAQIIPSDKIQLRGLKEDILWTELDRWSYEDPTNPEPPPYSIYTGLSIKGSMIAFIALSIIQCLVLGFVKYKTSEKFRSNSEKVFNKILHLLEGINLSFPFQDWDQKKCTVTEFRRRHKDVMKEMIASMFTNSVFSVIMLVPIWFTGNGTFVSNVSNTLSSININHHMTLIINQL